MMHALLLNKIGETQNSGGNIDSKIKKSAADLTPYSETIRLVPTAMCVSETGATLPGFALRSVRKARSVIPLSD